MTDLHEHDKKILEQVRIIEAAESRMRLSEDRLRKANLEHSLIASAADAEVRQAWDAIKDLMDETGEVEVLLPSELAGHVYKIAHRAGTETVDVPDVNALPAEFVKSEPVPKKKELLAHLKKLREEGAALPNYATIKRGESKLELKIVKKKPQSGS